MQKDCDNFIVKGSAWIKEDLTDLFDNQPVEFIEDKTIQALAVRIGAYKSKSEAQRAGRYGEIPRGYTEIWINKKRLIYMYNPKYYPEHYEEKTE